MIKTVERLKELIEKDTETARKLRLTYPEESYNFRQLVLTYQTELEYAEEIERLRTGYAEILKILDLLEEDVKEYMYATSLIDDIRHICNK